MLHNCAPKTHVAAQRIKTTHEYCIVILQIKKGLFSPLPVQGLWTNNSHSLFIVILHNKTWREKVFTKTSDPPSLLFGSTSYFLGRMLHGTQVALVFFDENKKNELSG